jgi:hypothetical protein
MCQRKAKQTLQRTSMAMNGIDDEREGSDEFSDLYWSLLNAVLDEAHSSASPRARQHNLAAHVARGISLSGIASESFYSQGLGHGETALL